MTKVSVSPALVEHIIDFLSSYTGEVSNDMVDTAINECVTQSEIFIKTFETLPFLFDEPAHEFEGITVRDGDSGKRVGGLSVKLVVSTPGKVYLCSVKEFPSDEMYEVRKVIAESHLPMYVEDSPQRTSPETDGPTDSSPSR